jgi:hypothetical protein
VYFLLVEGRKPPLQVPGDPPAVPPQQRGHTAFLTADQQLPNMAVVQIVRLCHRTSVAVVAAIPFSIEVRGSRS